MTVTFSILYILTDHDLFGSDVQQDCSFTVFAVFFFTLTKHDDNNLLVTFSFSFYADKYVQLNL